MTAVNMIQEALKETDSVLYAERLGVIGDYLNDLGLPGDCLHFLARFRMRPHFYYSTYYDREAPWGWSCATPAGKPFPLPWAFGIYVDGDPRQWRDFTDESSAMSWVVLAWADLSPITQRWLLEAPEREVFG